MKKIVWLCNSMPKFVAKRYECENAGGVSWIDSMMMHYYTEENNTVFYILFPVANKKYQIKEDKNFVYYPFFNLKRNPYDYDATLENSFFNLLQAITPNVIHIFGTEYAHTLAMMKATKRASMDKNTIINIQGLCTFIAKHYNAFLPNAIIHKYTFRDFIRHDNIYQQKKKFIKRGKLEVEAIQAATNIVGRTEWDKACIQEINPQAKYFKCNEMLRASFYEQQWDIDNCQRHSIFISQAYYPLKGFHILLEAVGKLVKKYPDIKVFTTGESPFEKGLIKIDSYSKYICNLIKKYGLEQHIRYLGTLNEQDMCRQYLKANVFVSASSIENSSNSLSEAMILGVPCIASDVGGTISLFQHEQDGFLYQADAPYLLAYYIDRIFSDDERAKKFSANSRVHALETHDKENIFKRISEIYTEVMA